MAFLAKVIGSYQNTGYINNVMAYFLV